MYTYAAGLLALGHEIRVLTADAPQWQKGGLDDPSISRELELANYEAGVHGDSTQAQRANLVHLKNEAALFRVLHDFAPGVCLLGNEAFLTSRIFDVLAASSVPIVHRIGHQWISFAPHFLPPRPRYRAAIVS